MIKIINGNFEMFNFPCGETNVKIKEPNSSEVDILFEFDSTDEIITLLLLCDAVKRDNSCLNTLYMPYVPFSRQDRVCNFGESFSLKVFCDLINNLNFKNVVVTDAHSIVVTALINNCKEITQYDALNKYINSKNEFYLISPDSGSLKKIYTFSKKENCLGIVECSKIRNLKTGNILETSVHMDNFDGKDCYIIDDICDGGRTFIEIAKILKKRNCGKIILLVTHGFFTKGINVFNNLIDKIYTRNGEIK